MSDASDDLIRRSGYSSAGFAARYDAHRPEPPPVLLDILCVLAQAQRPHLVVDLGSGTGLSTRVWADRAAVVVGVEANAQMRAHAEKQTTAANIRYEQRYSSRTGIRDDSADIVTCAQSLHWMEPESTFAEVARILRPGGVFAAYDYDLPPVVHPEVDAAFAEHLAERRRVRATLGMPTGATRWAKHEHLDRMRAGGRFRFVREIVFHSVLSGSRERLLGLALSIGPIPVEYENEPALAQLPAVASRVLPDGPLPFYFGYRARVAIK